MNHFLDGLEFPTLSAEDREVLDRPLELDELYKALANMQTGIAGGPDGLPIDIYKIFKDKLLPPLFDMVKEAFRTNFLPPSLSRALITNILKPGRLPSKCESY